MRIQQIQTSGTPQCPWLRTRNLLAVMLVHAALDLLSNAPDLLGAFGFVPQAG